MTSTVETIEPPRGPQPPTAGSPDVDLWSRLAWWPWAAGLMVGLVVVGPGLAGGSLLSLDLLVTPHIPVPNGMYGLGPALSQRVPMFAVLGLGSALVGGPVTTKVLLVAFTAVGFAGSARLVRLLAPSGLVVGPLAQLAAGVLWTAGPFALTRMGVGHINLLWAVAILPWVLPRLCHPADHLPSTFLASTAMAIGGPGGGTLGVTVALLALVLHRPRGRFPRTLAVVLVPHVIWVLPTAVLLWAGAGVTGAGGFATSVHGVAGWPSVAVGGGFWRADYQVGATGLAGALAGGAVGLLALVGGTRIVRASGVRSWQAVACGVGVVGLALAVATAVPGVRSVYGWLSDLPVGAPLRESHRFLSLWLVVSAPAAAVGASASGEWLARRARRPEPRARLVATFLLVVAVAFVSVPGWWGIDGRLRPVDYPAGWAETRTTIRDAPGTVVAFPWLEYPQLGFAAGRQAFNPLPDYLGGDVISSYDPIFDPKVPSQEQVDQRAVVVDRLSRRVRAGGLASADLARLGVRWLLVVHEPGWERYQALSADPGLQRRLARSDVDLYEVTDWSGPVTTPRGGAATLRRPVPWILRTDAPAGSTINVAGAPGWLQGWTRPVAVTSDGRLRTTGSAGIIWFWPAPLLVLVDLSVLVGAVWAFRSRRRNFGRILASKASRG